MSYRTPMHPALHAAYAVQLGSNYYGVLQFLL